MYNEPVDANSRFRHVNLRLYYSIRRLQNIIVGILSMLTIMTTYDFFKDNKYPQYVRNIIVE